MSTAAPDDPSPAPAVSKPVSLWVWAFRFLRWSTYLVALVTLLLVLHKAPPPAVQATSQDAARAEQKVAQVEESVSAGQTATLRLDEGELNSYLATHLDLAQAPPSLGTSAGGNSPAESTTEEVDRVKSSVRDVKVQMQGDRVRAYVVFGVHGKDMTLELEGRIGAADGYLKFEPVSGQIGSLPLPQSTLESAVERLMQSPLNREKLRLPPDVSDLRIENGELVATYR